MNLKDILKETSQYAHHANNTAKEYALLESGEWLELGKDCCLVERKHLLRYKIKENTISSEIVQEKFTICYGISITNICSLFLKKDWDVISINRISDEYSKYYILTIKKENENRIKCFNFYETWSLKDFEQSEMCQFLISLYHTN
jgi:hypothetical protein